MARKRVVLKGASGASGSVNLSGLKIRSSKRRAGGSDASGLETVASQGKVYQKKDLAAPLKSTAGDTADSAGRSTVSRKVSKRKVIRLGK